MKKLLGVLGVSLAILLGIIGYAYYTDNQNNEVYYVQSSNIVPFSTEELSSIETTEETTVSEEDTGSENTSVEEITVESNEEEWEETESVTEEKILYADASAHNNLSYAYSKLNDEEKELYDVIYTAIVNYEEGVTVPTLDTERLDKVFNCVSMDHPEIFYVSGYRFTKYTRGDELKRLAFTASYIYSQNERDKIQKNIDTEVDKILANVYSEATDYQIIRYIYDTIVSNTDYDTNSSDNQNIISVLINHRSVCQGYSKTMQLLLNKLGIQCTLVTGNVIGGESHAWNAVMSDGKWYYLDVTWGDSSYNNTDGTKSDFAPDINYDYFLVTSAEIDKNHKASAVVELPYAQSIDDNYYVREGLYLTSYNPEQLRAIFDYSRALGQKSVSFKCSDPMVYSQVKTELIDNQKIFDYIVIKQIKYADDPDTNKLMFALQ